MTAPKKSKKSKRHASRPQAAEPATQTPAGDERRLVALASRWAKTQERDLKLRWETGKYLVDRLGPPGQRHKRNTGVTAEVARRLGLTVSDVSRMRRFAHHFKTFQDVEKQGLQNWTGAKGFLDNLRANVRKRAAGRGSGKAARSQERWLRIVCSLTQDLKRSRAPAPTGDDLEQWKQTIQEFAEVVPTRLGFRLQVTCPTK